MITSHEEPAIGRSQWMLSFADLLSLILTFFVLIFSMANPMQQTNIFSHEYDSLINQESDINFSEIKIERYDSSISTDYLEGIIKDKLLQDEILQNIGVRTDHNKLIFSVPSLQISDELMYSLSDLLRVYDKRIHVYSVNLEFSKTIAEQLQENGITDGLGFYEQQDIKDRVDVIIYW